MFSWISIHHEAAQRLLGFRDRQEDLVALLRAIENAGVEMIRLTDQDDQGQPMPLTVMDPWTFFAAFNRGIKEATRIAAWTELKKQWNLTSAVPSDFVGLPVANNQRAWSFPYAYWLRRGSDPVDWKTNAKRQRDPEHINALWTLFVDVMQRGDGSVEPALFDKCLSLFLVQMKSLTMGLFWFKPRVYFPCDGKSQEKATKIGVYLTGTTAASYIGWCSQLRARGVTDIPRFSHEAYLESLGSDADAAYPLSQATFDRLWAKFAESCPDFVSFAQPGVKFTSEELNYKHKALKRFDNEREQLHLLLAQGQGLEALRMLQRSLTMNIVNHNSWRSMFGNTDTQATAVIQALVDVAEDEDPDWYQFFAVFDQHEVVPTWDALFQVLWALDPRRFSSIKISRFRQFASHCGKELPKGKPAADSMPAVLKMGQAFREKLAPWQPRDMTDVQSWMWHTLNRVLPSETGQEPDAAPPDVVIEAEPAAYDAPPVERPSLWLMAPGAKAFLWSDWQLAGEATIGWNELGDLNGYKTVDDVIKALEKMYDTDVSQAVNGSMLWSFVHEMKPGDYIVVKRGRNALLGWGKVAGDYRYLAFDEEHAHSRAVEWMECREVDVSSHGMLPMKTLTEIHPGASVHRLLSQYYGVTLPGWPIPPVVAPPQLVAEERYTLADATEGLFMPAVEVQRLVDTLRRKKNLILQGPPGVGKTFVASRLAYLLLREIARERIEMVQFHPSYAYEDFIQGLRPTSSGGFELREGIFVRFCRRAQLDPSRDYVFIIDEINRGNLSKIFGELMLLIERDKRGIEYQIPLATRFDDEDTFFVPRNVHLIGLMNTADRSLALVDYALRRRFAFATLRAGFDQPGFEGYLLARGAPPSLVKRIIRCMSELNQLISSDPQLGADFIIGHSFFTPAADEKTALDEAWYEDIIRHDVQPLLAEYWLDDPGQARARSIVTGLLA